MNVMCQLSAAVEFPATELKTQKLNVQILAKCVLDWIGYQKDWEPLIKTLKT